MTKRPGFGDLDRRQVLAWASYDWANSAFATTVMAGLLPVFFPVFWSNDATGPVTTYRLGVANSVAGLLVAVSAPILGAVADRGGLKKRLLAGFAFLGVLMTAGLAVAAEGQWLLASILYVLGTLGFSGANTFYDALLRDVAPERRYDFVSALGFAAGYLGGGLLFALNVVMVNQPQWFGFDETTDAVRASFVTVGVWWAVFSLPILLFVREHRPPSEVPAALAVREGLRQLKHTFREVRQNRAVWLFLLGYWLYIDGVDTIVRMAGQYASSLGLPTSDLIKALLMIQFIGFPATIAFGYFGERVGARRAILFAIAVYAVVTVWGCFLDSVAEFYTLAVIIGLVQGGIQALSRSFFMRLIPPDRTGQFFGFYNMLGKFAAVLGPILMGGVTLLTGSERLGLLSLLPLFLVGAALVVAASAERDSTPGS